MILRGILTKLILVDLVQLCCTQILPPDLDDSLMNWIILDKTAEICSIVAVVQLADVSTAFSRMIQVNVYTAGVYLLVTLAITHTAHAATSGGGGRCTKLHKNCMVQKKEN